MNAQDRNILRVTLLLVARSAPLGVTLEFAPVALRARAIQADTQEIKDEISYLVDKGLLVPVSKKLSPEIKAWRISADGRDFLAEEGHE